MAQYTGGEIIAKMLHKEGVENVFGIIDGTYFGFYSKLKENDITLISPRHETSAAHMAGAYARLSGKLGVCMASNGPGVANLLPGLVVEEGEGNRVLAITSSRRTGIMYPDRGGTYQLFDQVGVIKNISKWSETVPSFDRIPEMMRTALRKCYEGRPGVVHIDIPENIINGKFKAEIPFLEPSQYRLTIAPEPTDEQIDDVLNMIENASFPIIHAGSGVIHSQAFEELETVANELQLMITTSWAARGAIPENNQLMMPMIHIEANNNIRNKADLVLILGSRVGETDWWGKAPYWNANQKVIQVDIDPERIGVNKPVNYAILADIKAFLKKLHARLQTREIYFNQDNRRRTIEQFVAERDKNRQKLDKKLEDFTIPMSPAHVPATCQQVFPEDSPVVFDGGNATIWANFYYDILRPGSVLSTFKFGMLGAGMAQALGAAIAVPDRPIVCIIGDGAFGFHPQEVETAVRYNLHIVYVVLVDNQWGMVKMNQHFALKPIKTLITKSLSEEESIETDFHHIDFDKLAISMGANGERVSNPQELKGAFERALDSGKCSVIHVDVDPVKHMWAPGLKYFKDMHDEPKGK